MKSPRCESSSSPIGVSSETGSCETLTISRTLSAVMSIRSAISSAVGSRPSSWRRPRDTRMSLLIVSTMWTGMRMVRDGAGDGLSDPPRRVGRELVALAVVKLLDGANETDVPFLDEVEEAHAAADVLLRDRHDETEVGLGQVVTRVVALLDELVGEAA